MTTIWLESNPCEMLFLSCETGMRILKRTIILPVLLTLNAGCNRHDTDISDQTIIQDQEAFVRLSVDEQISLVGEDERLERKIDQLDVEIKSHPTAKNYLKRGVARTLKGEFERAIADFDSSIDLDPSNAQTHYNRGVVHSQLGKLQIAIADYTSAINADPKYSLAYANRGDAYIEIARFDDAITDLRKAIELDESNHIALHALAIALLDRPGRSIKDLRNARHLITKACELTSYDYDNYVQTSRAIEYAINEEAESSGEWPSRETE